MRALVSGGGGFLGKALCLRLRADGHEVRSISRGRYGELEVAGVLCRQADISQDLTAVSDAFEGVDVLFHTASKVEMWGHYSDFFEVNVLGTGRIIEACRRHGIKRLVYTSSPSVIADGTNLRGIDENYPYPKRYMAHYPATKAIAEREVLRANGKELYTAALRPHLIWGPGDTHLTATILARAAAGRLVRVGNGRNIVDLTFIDDCVDAHLCAASALESNPGARGRAYFISQGDPVSLWGWIDELLERNGAPRIKRSLPFWAAMTAAFCCEAGAKFRGGGALPLLTRFLVSEMATDHYFNISAARRELGYAPKLSVAQAMDRLFHSAGVAVPDEHPAAALGVGGAAGKLGV